MDVATQDLQFSFFVPAINVERLKNKNGLVYDLPEHMDRQEHADLLNAKSRREQDQHFNRLQT